MAVDPDEIEAMRSRLDPDQRSHLIANWTARDAEARRAEKTVTDPSPVIDPETTAAFAKLEPLADRILHHAGRSRSVGVGDDLIGCSIAAELLGLGHSEEETVKIIAEAGIDWHFRTADERLVAAAAELLAMGMEPATTRAAFAGLAVH